MNIKAALFLLALFILPSTLSSLHASAEVRGFYQTVTYIGAEKYYVKARKNNDGIYYLEIFDEQKRLRMRGTALDYEGSTRIDKWQFFYENGRLESEGTYVQGYKMGEWKRYFKSGIKKANRFYNPGRIELLEDFAAS